MSFISRFIWGMISDLYIYIFLRCFLLLLFYDFVKFITVGVKLIVVGKMMDERLKVYFFSLKFIFNEKFMFIIIWIFIFKDY